MNALLALLLAVASSVPASAAARTLTVCDDVQDPLTLDPHKEFSEKNHTLVQQMFEGLVRFGPDGQIEPALAVEWRRVDDLTLQFKLRQGVSFHNGERFDANAVKFSIDRYLDPKTGFPALGFIDSISRAEPVDENTVNIVTKYPDGLLLNRLAGFIVMVAPKHYSTNPDSVLLEQPVGTGPFRFKRWLRSERIELDSNRKYWASGTPAIDGLHFVFLPIPRQVDSLLSGDIDVLMNLPGTRTLDVQRSAKAAVIKKPTFYTVGGNFNVSRPPLSNARVREAINLAIDRKSLVRYDILGNGVPIGTLSLPGEFGHNETLEPYSYDPAKARSILAEEGYSKGFSLKLLLKVNASRTGQIIATHLQAIGIRLDSTLVTDAQLFESLKNRDQWDIAMYDVPDPMHHAFFIRSIFLYGKSPFSLSAVPELDKRFDLVATTIDSGKQKAASEELDAYIHANYLALPTYQRIRTYGVRRGVRFTPYVSGMPYFHGVTIDGAGD